MLAGEEGYGAVHNNEGEQESVVLGQGRPVDGEPSEFSVLVVDTRECSARGKSGHYQI